MERDAPLPTRPTTKSCVSDTTKSVTENASNVTTKNDSPRDFAPPAVYSEKLNLPGPDTPPMSPIERKSSVSYLLDTDYSAWESVVLHDCDEYTEVLCRDFGTDPYSSNSDSDTIEIINESVSRKSHSSSLSLGKDDPIRSSPQLDTTTCTKNASTGTCTTTTDMLDKGSKESEDTQQAVVSDDGLAGETEIKVSDQNNLASIDPPCTLLSDDNALSPVDKEGKVDLGKKQDESEDIATEVTEIMPPACAQLIDCTQEPEETLHTNEIWDLDNQSTFFELPEGWEVVEVVESALNDYCTPHIVVENDISSNSLPPVEHVHEHGPSIGEEVNTFLDSLLTPEHQSGTKTAVLQDTNPWHVDSDLLEQIHPKLAGVGWDETLNNLDLVAMKGLQVNDENKISSWSDSDFISQTVDHEEVINCEEIAAGTESRNSDNGENEIPIIKKHTRRRKSRKQRDRERSAVHLHIHNVGGEIIHSRPRHNSVARALKLIRQSKHNCQNIKMVRMTRRKPRHKNRWPKKANQNARKSPTIPTMRNILSDEDSEISVQKEQAQDLNLTEFWRLEWSRSRELYSSISEASSPRSSTNTPPQSEIGEAEQAQAQPDQLSPNLDKTGAPYSTTLKAMLETLPEKQQVSTALLDKHAMSSTDVRIRYANNWTDGTCHTEIRQPATVTLHYPHEPIIGPSPSNHPQPSQIGQQTAIRSVDSPLRPHTYTSKDEILQQHVAEYRKTLSQCDVCMRICSVPSVASLCLRTHGKSKCWICFMLISFRKGSFAKHNKAFHPFAEQCRFCPHGDMVLEINLEFRQHMEREHFHIPVGLWSADLKAKLKSKRGRKITLKKQPTLSGSDLNNENEENRASESCPLDQPLRTQIEAGVQQQQQSGPSQNFGNQISHRRDSKEQMSCISPIKPGGHNNGDLINLSQNHQQLGPASKCVENDNSKVCTTFINSQTELSNKYLTSSTPSKTRLPVLLDDPRQGYISVIVPNTKQHESTCNASSTIKGDEGATTNMSNYHAMHNQRMTINNYNYANKDDQEREILDPHVTYYSNNCQNSADALNDRWYQFPDGSYSYHDRNRYVAYPQHNYSQGPTSQYNNYNPQHRSGLPVRFVSQNQAQVGGAGMLISTAQYPYQICTRDSSPYFCPPILNSGNRLRNNPEVQFEQDWNLESPSGGNVVGPSSRRPISTHRPFETYPSFHATVQDRAPTAIGQAPPAATASNYNCANTSQFVGRCKPVLEAILNGAKVPILLTPFEINTVSSAISTWFSTISQVQFLKLKQVGPTIWAFIMSSANLPSSQKHPMSNDFWECMDTLNNWLQ